MASSHYKKSNAIQNHSSNKSEEAVQRFASMMIERMTALKNENWEKGWFNGIAYEGLPQNYSGRTYNASNSFMLQLISSMNGYSMPVFMTFKQAKDNGVHINKGEASFPVVYWDVNIKDAYGNRIDYDDYKNLTKEEREKYHVTPFLKYYPVFNIDQTNFKEVKPEKYEALKENFGIPEIKDAEGMYTHNALDSMVQKQSWVCPVRNDQLSADAYYSPSRDVVVLPMKAQFKKHKTEAEIYVDGMGYYSTMLHEMAHSTGHKERLDRTGGKFGDPKYAKEELVAELTSAMICNSMGFDSKITDNSAKYLDNWLGALKEDPKFIVSVMADVNKAAEMILDKVDKQRLALGETPYLSKNMVAVENGYSLEPEFKPAQELVANEPNLNYGNNIDPETQKLIDDVVSSEKSFRYQMLGRLAADCEYYLGYGNKNADGLWAHDEVKQIEVMKALHNSFSPDEKPQWLSMEKILEYQDLMQPQNNYKLADDPSIMPIEERIIKEPIAQYSGKLTDDEKSKFDNSLVEQYNRMKEKYPDALILMRVGDLYELFDNDAKIASGILNTELIKGTAKDSVYLTAFNHSALDTYLPMLVKAGQRIAICETTIQQKKLVKRGITESVNPNVQVTPKDLEDNLKNDNTMAKKKKKEEPVPEIQEQANVNEQQVESNKEKEVEKRWESHFPSKKELEELPVGSKIEVKYKMSGNITSYIKPDKNGWDEILDTKTGQKRPVADHDNFEFILKDKYDNNEYLINILPGKGIKQDAKKEETVKQPREPQMVTVNGDKVSNGHVYNLKDDPEKWFFVARLNNKNLIPIQISPQEASNFIENKNIEEMMQKCYPTKLMPKVPADAYKFPQFIETAEKNLEVSKFYVFKGEDPTKESYGKLMFCTKIGDKNMVSLAGPDDLNAYFDRVKTPTQIIEKLFGERLNLASHYANFQLPNGVNGDNIRIFADKDDPKKTIVSVNINGVGKKAKPISNSDSYSYYRVKTATKEQIAAKYLGSDIEKMLAKGQGQKMEKTNALKP